MRNKLVRACLALLTQSWEGKDIADILVNGTIRLYLGRDDALGETVSKLVADQFAAEEHAALNW